MKTELIVMLGHKSKVGKDTLADILVKKEGFVKVALADKLKEVCSDLFFIDLEEFYDEKLKNEEISNYKMTRRRILQIVGQSMFQINKDIWVKHAISKIIASQAKKIVITDFRFPHEIDSIRLFAALYGIKVIPIKIERDGIGKFSGSEDPSEISLQNYEWPIILQNNSTIGNLYNTYKSAIESYINEKRAKAGT